MKIAAQAGPVAAAASLATAAVATTIKTKKADPLMHVTAVDGVVTFACTSRDITIKATADADIAEAGAAAVSAKRLAELLSGFGAGAEIGFKHGANALTITGGAARYRLQVDPDPPDLPAIKDGDEISVSGAGLSTLLSPVAAASDNKHRYYMCGVLLHTVGEDLVAVATNGNCLIRTSIMAGPFSQGHDLIVPTESVAALRKIVRQVKPATVQLRRSKALLSVTAAGFEFVTALIDGTFPDYKRLIRPPSPNSVTVDSSELRAALSRMAAVAAAAPVVGLAWTGAAGLDVCLARQPLDGSDTVSAESKGAAKLMVPLAQLVDMLGEFTSPRLRLESDGSHPLAIHDEIGKLAMICQSRFDVPEFAQANEAAPSGAVAAPT